MEVSNEIKEDIRKTQSDLKNAIKVHQVWVARLQEDENNLNLKSKVRDAEKEIIAISQIQKRVVDRLRRELELYQQRLKLRNRPVNVENDSRYIAQQLRNHQLQFHSKSRNVSLLKPSVLNEIHVKIEHNNGDPKLNEFSDSDSENKSSNEKENSNYGDLDDKDQYMRNYKSLQHTVHDSRNNFANALNKVKESLINCKRQSVDEWQDQPRSDSDLSHPEIRGISLSPSPPPPLLPAHGEEVTQETFLRLIGLVTPQQRDLLEKKRSERKKRSTTSTNKNDFLYENFEPKRKKNQFPYLQSHSDPPQTRSAKLRKQKKHSENSREGSPSGSSGEKPEPWSGKPAWASTLPPGLTVEPVYTGKKVCHGCGRNDVPSLLVRCMCGVFLHTGCGTDGQCTNCDADLPDPTHCASSPSQEDAMLYRDKLAERKRLQERNIQLCVELRKLEARAATLKENLEDHHLDKRELLADQIKTQRNLQKLLDFISQFKETSVSMRSTSLSETGSEISKSCEE